MAGTRKDQGNVGRTMGDLFSELSKIGGGLILAWFVLTFQGLTPGFAGERSSSSQLRELNKHVELAIEVLQKGDFQGAKQHFRNFDEGWERVEDGIRSKSRETYRKIERSMSDVKIRLLKPEHPDKTKALSALEQLQATIHGALPALK